MSTVAVPTAALTRWDFDPAHTLVEFTVTHLMITKVRGRFAEVTGHVDLPADGVQGARAEVTMVAASLDTRNADRDAHLRSPDFLDVDTHPSLTFRSTGIEAGTDGTFQLLGDLTIRGVTRPVVLDVQEEGSAMDPWGGSRIAWSAEKVIDRRDFGLTWNAALETGGVLVGNDVRIALEVQPVRQQNG